MQFKEIIGHSNIKQSLIKTVKDNRISHAQLFLGKEGCGNLPLAIAYAQYISCINKSDVDSCGVCPSCVKYQKLIHPDLHFVFPVATSATVKTQPVSANYIEQWRATITNDPYLSLSKWQSNIETENKQLLISAKESENIIKIIGFKTYESEYKVMIIWFPEKLNIASGNRLLKILEEPPSKTLFILVAYDAEQLISTILSRVHLVKIGKIDTTDLQNKLTQSFGLDENSAQELAHLADGNYIRAQELMEQSAVDESFYQLFTQWVRAAFQGDVLTLIKWTENIALNSFGREKQKQFLNYALHIFRESLIHNYGNASLNRIAKNEATFLTNFSPFIHGANCIEIIELFNDATYHIERNANPKMLFLDLSLKLTKLLRVKAPVFEINKL